MCVPAGFVSDLAFTDIPAGVIDTGEREQSDPPGVLENPLTVDQRRRSTSSVRR